MTLTEAFKLSFTAGEIAPELLGRGDLRAYENGAKTLRNVTILPTGGVTRRPGLHHLARVAGPARLIAFEFSSEQTYLLVFSDRLIEIYETLSRSEGGPGALKITQIAAPWSAAQLDQLAWTQTADTLLVVHPDVAPKLVVRLGAESWAIENLTFPLVKGSTRRQLLPRGNFFNSDPVTFSFERLSRTRYQLRASRDYFNAGHLGVVLHVGKWELTVLDYVNPTLVEVDTHGAFPIGDHEDIEEPLISSARGWPASVALYQDRLVLAGARDLPNRIWMSKTSDLYNFDLGEGLDDEAIDFPLFSDQVNAIRAIFVGRHLLVFTSGAEWMVTGSPLAPDTIEVQRQTHIGLPVDRQIPPRDVDGATLYIDKGLRQLREFVFTDLEQAYQSNDLSLLAPHMIREAADMDYDSGRRLLIVVNGDGSAACLTQYRAEQVTAWSRWDTAGAFRRVAVSGGEVFFLTERDGAHAIEALDETLLLDAALQGEAEVGATLWSGLDHLEDQEVTLIADGLVLPGQSVDSGAVTLDEPARQLEAGLTFTLEIEPLPPLIASRGRIGYDARLRVVEISFRLLETMALTIDIGRGLEPVSFLRYGDALLDRPPPPFTGDKTFRALGWRSAGTALWRIESDLPQPLTLLSVFTNAKVTS